MGPYIIDPIRGPGVGEKCSMEIVKASYVFYFNRYTVIIVLIYDLYEYDYYY